MNTQKRTKGKVFEVMLIVLIIVIVIVIIVIVIVIIVVVIIIVAADGQLLFQTRFLSIGGALGIALTPRRRRRQ